jgi:hypothetical protein
MECTEVWNGRPLKSVRVSAEDEHPNPLGNRLIADCFFDQLERQAAALGIRPLLPAAP